MHIWNIEATGAKTAIAIAAYPQAPLKDFRIDHVNIAADNAGSIANTDNLILDAITLKVPANNRLKTEDNTSLKDIESVRYE